MVVKIMVETQLASGGSMMGLAVIIAIVIIIFPFLVYWLAWFAVVILFIGGLIAVMQQ
jgi:hypothetical protein